MTRRQFGGRLVQLLTGSVAAAVAAPHLAAGLKTLGEVPLTADLLHYQGVPFHTSPYAARTVWLSNKADFDKYAEMLAGSARRRIEQQMEGLWR